MTKLSLFGLCSFLPKYVGMLSLLFLSQACAQSQQYAPWITEDDTSEEHGIDGAPSLVEFRGAEAPFVEDVSIPPYPQSRLFSVESETTLTQGPFHDECPQRRGLILVTHDAPDEVANWYENKLEMSLKFNPRSSRTFFLWGRYAEHDWGPNYKSRFVMGAPHVAIHELEKNKMGAILAPFRTVIDVMYCE